MTADPKLLMAQVASDVAHHKVGRLAAKLGGSPASKLCKAVDECTDPAIALSIGLLSDYLTINVNNMGPNPVLGEIAAANNATQMPVNQNTIKNVLDQCEETTNITSYVTGHTRLPPNGSFPFYLDVYTEWISVGLDYPDSTCQRNDQEGPSCAVVCARRGMACNPCAMKAATANLNSFAWAASQAGNNAIALICGTAQAQRGGGSTLPKGAGTGWFGYICSSTPDDNFLLYACNAPDYDKLATDEKYFNACEVPTWRIGSDVFNPPGTFVGAQGGALCYCSGTSIVPPA